MLENSWNALINCEVNLELTWSTDFVISSASGETKLYVPVVTLSIQDSAKLLEQLKSGFLKEQLTGTNMNRV